MNETDYYIAFPCSEQLLLDANKFLGRMHQANPSKETELLARTLCQLTDEVVDAYLVDLFRNVNLAPSQLKALDIAESAMRKTSHTLINKLAKKLDLSQQIKISNHLQSIILPLERSNLHRAEFIAFPVESHFFEELRAGYENIRAGVSYPATQTIIRNQKSVIDKMCQYLIDDLLKILQLGPVSSKLTVFARDTCIKLMHSTTGKILSNMDAQELATTCNQFEEMTISNRVLAS